MKRTICLGVAAVALGLGACERHEWEETKELYEAHGHDKDKGAAGEKDGVKEPGDGKGN